MAAAAGVAGVLLATVGEPHDWPSALAVWLGSIAGGAVEGLAVGSLQFAVLRPWLPRLRRARWAGVTVLVALAGWALGMAPSSLWLWRLDDEAAGAAAGPPMWLMPVGGAALGLLLGAVGHVTHPRRWVTANALGCGGDGEPRSVAAEPSAAARVTMSTSGSGSPRGELGPMPRPRVALQSSRVRSLRLRARSRMPGLSPRGVGMPKVVLTHSVEDVERWLTGKEERAGLLGSAGSNVTDYVAMDGSNNIAVTVDVHDMEAAQAMLTSPPAETLAAMQRHGVIPPVTAYIER